MRTFRLLALSAISSLASITPTQAQVTGGVVFIPPVTANHCVAWNSPNVLKDAGAACGTGGSGTVTSVGSGAGLTGGPITGSGTLSATEILGNSGAPITGTTYTINLTAPGDLATELVFTGSSASAWTLGAGAAGKGFDIVNHGSASITVTATGNITSCTGSTCTNASTMVVAAGTFANVFYDATNSTWRAALSQVGGGGSGTVNSGTAGDGTYYAATGTAVSDANGAFVVSFGAINITTGSATPSNGLNIVNHAGDLGLWANGNNMVEFDGSGLFLNFHDPLIGNTAGSFQLNNTAASTTAPSVVLNRGDTASGLGGAASVPAVIVGSASIMNWASTGPTILVIPADTGTTDTTLCRNTSTHAMSTGTGTLGVCLGTSSMRAAKKNIADISSGGILELDPVTFTYKPGFGDNGARKQHGFIAEDFSKVYPELTRYDQSGNPNGVDILGVVPDVVSELKRQQREIDELWVALGVLSFAFVGSFIHLKRRAA